MLTLTYLPLDCIKYMTNYLQLDELENYMLINKYFYKYLLSHHEEKVKNIKEKLHSYLYSKVFSIKRNSNKNAMIQVHYQYKIIYEFIFNSSNNFICRTSKYNPFCKFQINKYCQFGSLDVNEFCLQIFNELCDILCSTKFYNDCELMVSVNRTYIFYNFHQFIYLILNQLHISN